MQPTLLSFVFAHSASESVLVVPYSLHKTLGGGGSHLRAGAAADQDGRGPGRPRRFRRVRQVATLHWPGGGSFAVLSVATEGGAHAPTAEEVCAAVGRVVASTAASAGPGNPDHLSDDNNHDPSAHAGVVKCLDDQHQDGGGPPVLAPPAPPAFLYLAECAYTTLLSRHKVRRRRPPPGHVGSSLRSVDVGVGA